jgi:hypothetical protein
MQSKLSINSSSRVSRSLGLKIHHKIIMAKETITHRMKDIESKVKLNRSSPRHRQIRVTRSLIKTLESGVSSTTTPRTTPMNVSRNSHWWPRSKKNNQNLNWSLIQRTIKGKHIIDVEPTTTIVVTTIQSEEP